MSPSSGRVRSTGPADAQAADRAAVTATTELASLSLDSAARLPRLLEAMVSIGTGPELHSTLDRIVETAARLGDCRYAALGVLADDPDDGLKDFVTCGMSEEQVSRIEHYPDGKHGLLAVVIEQEEPLRLHDLMADPRSCGFPANHPPMHSFLGLQVKVGDEVFGNLYLTEKRGGDFTANDVQLLRVLATQAGIAIGNARLYEAARQRERWIDGNAAITTSLLAGDGDDALAVIAEQARTLAEADGGLVLLPTEEDAEGEPGADSASGSGSGGEGAKRGQQVVAASADRAQGLIGTVVPADNELLGTLECGEPVYLDDAASDPRIQTGAGRRYGPVMMLPLRSGSRVRGVLAVGRERGGKPFSEAEKELAAQFAAQAALALVLLEAQRDRERLAVYEDRDRIARDLHDLVIQRLFATGLRLESAQRRTVVPQVAEDVAKAVDELDATIAEIRTAIFALRQHPEEAPSGLRTRVLREVGLAAVPLGFRPSASFDGAVDALVPEHIAKELVAALREALSNAHRHAGASRIEVAVDGTAELPGGRPAVRLTVADDGRGMPEGGRRSGLRNIARRAESLGGETHWGPGLGGSGTSGGGTGGGGAGGGGTSGAGTTVSWTVPLDGAAG
ncbi:GAF domain-containing protein [Streptomyces sp. ODS28]|uniref:GAF domain-containing sensor histidine kinase n=1 Tax=Streptomyces sp. ODS28 TaxID=3136688 RepID=UPI0031E54C8A